MQKNAGAFVYIHYTHRRSKFGTGLSVRPLVLKRAVGICCRPFVLSQVDA